MLSNITSYLFGGYQNAEVEKENVRFEEVEDEDWMVIEKCEKKRQLDDDLIISSETYLLPELNARPPVPDTRRRSISCKRLANRRCSTPLRELSPACISKALVPYVPKKESRSSSKSSSRAMEESWFITPPPCFVSGPYETKPSSLENLLIEQPGVNFPVVRLTEEPSEVNQKVAPKVKERKETKKQAPKEEDKRKQLMDAQEQRRFLNVCQSQLNAAQKLEQKIPDTKRNQLDRLNRVQYELSSRRKRQRRADLNKKHSGVNNNRKCCY